MPKRYLNCAGNSDMHRWIEDNPWNKIWTNPAWRNLAQEQRNQILNAQKKH
jgi:hypothetical protein